jgi:hypothetical protein
MLKNTSFFKSRIAYCYLIGVMACSPLLVYAQAIITTLGTPIPLFNGSQQSAGWKTLAPIGQQCPAGSKTVNCWDYLCTIDPKPTANGVKTATCRCPINEGVFGHPAGGNEIYVTAAGGYFGQNGGDKLKQSDACKMFPVSGPIPQPNQ